MENKINIANLLRDCPSGMELNCLMYEDVYFDYVVEHNMIHCYIQHETYKTSIIFNQYGTTNSDIKAKCVIFPKGKTTWDGFMPPSKFKDGDIVVTKTSNNFIFYSIYKGVENNKVLVYVDYHLDSNRLMFNDNLNYLCFIDEIVEQRFATEEEKAKLFDAIKDNGYHWNKENKTLEKLVIKPKFKVGDRVRHHKYGKGDVTQIIWMDNEIIYEIHFENLTTYCKANELCKYELLPTKFDITTLKPFKNEVLVRDSACSIWRPAIFGCIDKSTPGYCGHYYVLGGICWRYCIPYEGNEHLLGTADDCDEYFKTWE